MGMSNAKKKELEDSHTAKFTLKLRLSDGADSACTGETPDVVAYAAGSLLQWGWGQKLETRTKEAKVAAYNEAARAFLDATAKFYDIPGLGG